MKFNQLIKYILLKENWIKTVFIKPIGYNKILVDVFKNESLRLLPEDCRAIIDENSDLITINWSDNEFRKNKNLNINKFIIHDNIVHAYEENNTYDMNDSNFYKDKYILIQRVKNTNIFALSESYNEYQIKYIQENRKEQIEKCQEKNKDKIIKNQSIYDF